MSEAASPVPNEERENLVAYLDGELDDAAAEKVHAALGRDPRLREEAAELSQTWDLLNYLPRPQAPQDFTQKTVQRLETAGFVLRQRSQRWRRLAILGWIATLVVSAVLSFLLAFYWPGGDRPLTAALPSNAAALPQPSGPEEFPDPRLLPPAAPVVPGGRPLHERQWERALLWLRLEIARLERELEGKLSKGENMLLREKRQAGGLEYLDALLELAKTHGIPLRAPGSPGAGPTPRPRPSAASTRPTAPTPP